MNRRIKIYSLLLSVLTLCSLGSCKKYLDLKPNKSMVLPQTLADCQALLDNSIAMNLGYPAEGEAVADNYYLTFPTWNGLIPFKRDGYIWKANADVDPNDWLVTYEVALNANQALKTLGAIVPTAANQAQWNQVKASALFFRAFTYFQASQIWTQPYSPATAATDPGIPLHLTPDISEMPGRGTLQETYNQILQDLNDATSLFANTKPTSNITKMRPGLAAAHALLARVYLAMGDYPNAQTQADLCLQNYGELIDYNTVDPGSGAPFPKFNTEVIFEAATASLPLFPFNGKVDSSLYASYDSNGGDLRKALYFQENAGSPGTYQFKGSYEGSPYSIFCGIATDEMYLTRAECYARGGNTAAAMADLNTLLSNRYQAPYTDRTAVSADDALAQILTERRKELLYRCLRWADLRRLNKDPRFAVTLTRNLNGTIYTLPPNDLRYTLLIPLDVLKREPMAQNPR